MGFLGNTHVVRVCLPFDGASICVEILRLPPLFDYALSFDINSRRYSPSFLGVAKHDVIDVLSHERNRSLVETHRLNSKTSELCFSH